MRKISFSIWDINFVKLYNKYVFIEKCFGNLYWCKFYIFRYLNFRSLLDKNRVSILSPAVSKFLRVWNEQSKHMLGYVLCVVWLWWWFLEGYLMSKWMRLHAVFKTITNYQHKGITLEQNKRGEGGKVVKKWVNVLKCVLIK